VVEVVGVRAPGVEGIHDPDRMATAIVGCGRIPDAVRSRRLLPEGNVQLIAGIQVPGRERHGYEVRDQVSRPGTDVVIRKLVRRPTAHLTFACAGDAARGDPG